VTIPATLKKALENRTVVPFVGAGLSMTVLKKGSKEALFPSWKQLLLKRSSARATETTS
jgi:hypothetical protein